MGRHPSCSLHLVLSVQQMRLDSTVSRALQCGKQQFSFPCFLSPSLRETMRGVSARWCSRLGERQCCPVFARDNVTQSQPNKCSRFCERHCCFLVSCFQCACASYPFLSVVWLVDARIPHDVISHLVRTLDHCFCCVILRIKTACLTVVDIQRATRVSSTGSLHSQRRVERRGGEGGRRGGERGEGVGEERGVGRRGGKKKKSEQREKKNKKNKKKSPQRGTSRDASQIVFFFWKSKCCEKSLLN